MQNWRKGRDFGHDLKFLDMMEKLKGHWTT